MLPIGDDNPTRLTPVVNWSIIVVCVLVFLWQTSSGSRFFSYTLFTFGLVPDRVVSGDGFYTFVTNMFFHGNWVHLLGNMLFLWIFGDNIEDSIASRSNSKLTGHLYYLAFYLVSGFSASVFWLFTAWGSNIPAIGASGAISGVLGAYFILYPTRRVSTLIPFFFPPWFFWRVVRMPAYVWIGIWFILQFFNALSPIETEVAFWAHVAGFVIGAILGQIFRPRFKMVQTYYRPDLDD